MTVSTGPCGPSWTPRLRLKASLPWAGERYCVPRTETCCAVTRSSTCPPPRAPRPSTWATGPGGRSWPRTRTPTRPARLSSAVRSRGSMQACWRAWRPFMLSARRCTPRLLLSLCPPMGSVPSRSLLSSWWPWGSRPLRRSVSWLPWPRGSRTPPLSRTGATPRLGASGPRQPRRLAAVHGESASPASAPTTSSSATGSWPSCPASCRTPPERVREA